ncbi:MAG: hypothetical protein QOF45_1126 [Gaiellaceae bacterium]|nr:hypothetical protein [Gaiellaceae bacterium]
MTRLLIGLAAVAALSGCGAGAGGPAGPALRETATKLETIKTGVLTLKVNMDPKDGDAFGYEIHGPIKLAGEGEVPLADVEYTQRANGQEDTVRLVLDENGGWVERGGERTQLTRSQLDELRSAGSVLGQGGLESLDFEAWIADPKRSDGPGDTDKVSGKLDVVAAMNGLAGLSGVLGSDPVRLDKSNGKQVEDAVKDSSFELLTGKDDRLLRKLALMFEFDADVPDELRDELGKDAVGARFEFDLALDDVNQPVAIG